MQNASAVTEMTTVLRGGPSPARARVLSLSPRALVVEDVELPVGARCGIELCTPDLRLTGRGVIADRSEGRCAVTVTAWDGAAAERAVRDRARRFAR